MELESERRRNMIFDSISNKENYKEEKEIYQTLNFLEKLKKWDIETLPCQLRVLFLACMI